MISESKQSSATYSYWNYLPSLATVVQTSLVLTAISSIAMGALSMHHAFFRTSNSPSPPFLLKEFQNCLQTLEDAKTTPPLCESRRDYRLFLSDSLPKRSNLEWAEEIMWDTYETVRFSPNNLARSKELIEKETKQKIVVADDLENPQCLYALRKSSNWWTDNTFQNMRKIAALSMKMGIGNCGEMAAVALFKGMEKGVWSTQLESVYLEGGDHALALLGRDPHSDPKNYTTWGDEAVFIDAWAPKFYKLAELERQLENWLYTNRTTGEPQLRPFDPKIHKLSIDFGNLYTPKELSELKKTIEMSSDSEKIYDALIEKLEQFLQTESLQKKIMQAKELSSLCEQFLATHPSIFLIPWIRSIFLISWVDKIESLRDQMDYFIELFHH